MNFQLLSVARLAKEKRVEAPTVIPSGVYLNSIRLVEAGGIRLSGYAWQRYPATLPEEFPRGFRIGGAEEFSAEEVDRRKQGSAEVVRWRFQALVRERFDHSHYPLEQESVTVDLLPAESQENLLLVPDLDAYPLMSPTLLPGVNRDAFIPGWTLLRSYYVLKERPVNTTYGITRTVSQLEVPTLRFMIDIRREFLDAFISNLTPVIVVGLILFCVLLISTQTEYTATLSICIGAFLVIAFSHIDVRLRTGTNVVFYLEYFYFITYAAILGVAALSLRTPLKFDSKILQYKEMLVPKVLYWPVILGFLLAVSVVTFY